jgi:hypothetical protein
VRPPEPSASIGRVGAALALAGLLAGALALRIWGIDYGLPNVLCRPDEEKIVAPAAVALREGRWRFGSFMYPGLLPHLNWLVMGIADGLGRWTGRFDSVEGSFSEWPQFHYEIGRLVSACFGVATVLVGYRLARETGLNRNAALFAALAISCSHLHVRDSHAATADVPVTFFVALTLQLALRARRVGGGGSLLAAALAGGLATSTKYQGVVVMLAPLFVVVERALAGGAVRRLPRDLAIVALAPALAFAATSPIHVLNLAQAVKEGLETSRAVLVGRGEPGLLLHPRLTLPEGVGLPLVVLAALGLFWLGRVRRGELAVLLAFAVPWSVVIARTHWVVPRYATPLVPVFALLGAAGFAWLGRSAAVRLALVVLLLASSLPRSVAFDRVAARPDTRLVVAEWASRELPSGARVLVCEGYGFVEVSGRRSRAVDCSSADILWGRADAILLPSHPHLGGWLRVSSALQATVQAKGRLLARFDPFLPGRVDEAEFYVGDAFFIPMRGLTAVERGGPVYEAWALPREGGAFEARQ